MGFDFQSFGDGQLSEAFVEWLIDEKYVDIGSHFGRLWDYYLNPMYDLGSVGGLSDKIKQSTRNYVQAQESGLPARITGCVYSGGRGAILGRAMGEKWRFL